MGRNRRNRSHRRKKGKYNYKINEAIKGDKIRLVGEDFEEISEVAGKELEQGIYPRIAALQWAQELGKDLVLISPKPDPVVCKIIDYNKFLYKKKKKEKEIKKNSAKTEVKEIRFGPNTDDHDFNFKKRHAKNFLQDGNKVKAYVHFRGRTIVFKDRGELLLLRLIKELEEYGSAESLPKMEGRRMIVMIAPQKNKGKN